jgi:hypothetical protein
MAAGLLVLVFLTAGLGLGVVSGWGKSSAPKGGAAKVQYVAKKKCNAGRGNGSEGCDPGNSSTSPNGSTGQNQGGDEGGPIRGGTGAP